MSGIIVPSDSPVKPVGSGVAAGKAKKIRIKKGAIDPSRRITKAYAGAAPALHAPQATIIPVTKQKSVATPEPTTPTTHNSRRRTLVLAAAAVVAIGFVFMAAQLGLMAAYAGRFLPGVSVAGQQLGGLTRPQAQQLLNAKAASTRVRFVAGTTPYDLTPSAAAATYDSATTLDQAYAIGHQPGLTFMPLAIWQSLHHQALAMNYDINQPKLQALVQKIVDGSGQLPVDASIVVNNGVPTTQAAIAGHALGAPTLNSTIQTQLEQPGTPTPTLHPTEQQARIQVSDLNPALDQTKQILATPVSITYQSKSFHPTAAQIGTWIIYDKSPPNERPGLKPKINPDAISSYLVTIAKQINVSPVTQKVNVQNGVSSVYQQGKNGLTLDSATLATQIAAMTPGQPLSLVAPTAPVAFSTQYNNSVPLPYDQYIEVNLSSQHLWVYQNHTVIFDSPITSGATGAGFPTATGLFSIQAKQTNRHLIGAQYGPAYNYDVFVQYWMPFYQGFGLHDASWRSSFGGQDYYYGGSHGCVNLPLATAAYLYNWSSVGTPVWVHA